MSKKSLCIEEGRKRFEEQILKPENLPVSFTYGEVCYNGLGGLELVSQQITDTAAGQKALFRYRIDETMEVVLDAAYCAEFGEVEYTLWFENPSSEVSKVLGDVYCLNQEYTGEKPVLRSCLGDHENFYAPYEYDLNQISKYFKSDNGRATHIVFPYFDLVHGDGGTLLAIGWAGTWDAVFSAHADCTTVRVRTCITLNGALLSGEKIRTGLVVQLPYAGRNGDDATNLWREWFMKYNLPKANAEGEPLTPFSTSSWCNDTGLPNSDGSISERSFTWRRTLDKVLKEKVASDFRWFDAGWYFDPAGRTVETDWWGTVGSWELDTEKWPGHSFLESNEACHAVGMKVLMWFEPERVTHVEDLVKNYGYNPEWAASGDGVVYTNNLGNEECLQWTLNRITKILKENGVDMYREDNNSDPATAWGIWDAADTEKYHVPRAGMNENKSIQGHYKLWDGIITFCAANGKCTFVDSCASGGGRNDIESMRRGFPLMRSDYDRTSSSMRMSQTSSFCKWIPFHGSCVKETETQLEASKGSGADAYINRASLLPIYNYTEAFTQNPELDFDQMRRNIAEWKSVRHLLTKDFYVLTPWHHEMDRYGWTSWAYEDADTGEGLLLAFRMEECRHETLTVRMEHLNESAVYEIRNVDTADTVTLPGAELKKGFTIALNEPRSSAMYRIWRV